MAAYFRQNGGSVREFEMPQLPTQLGGMVKWGLVLAALIVLFIILNFLKTAYTDWLWFGQLGFRSVYVKMITTRVALFVVGGVAMAAMVGTSLLVANRLSRGPTTLPLPPEAAELLQKLVVWGTVAAVVVLSVIFGSIAAGQWEVFLRFFGGTSFDTVEPVFGRDVSFYVFTLPLFEFAQGWLLGAVVVTGLATVGVYFVNFSLRNMSFELTPALRVHASVIGALIMFLLAAGHWLDRWDLVLSDQGAVFGAAFTDIHARKPALLILAIVAVGAGVLMLLNVRLAGVRLLVGAAALWVVMAIVLGAAWPAAMQRFTVNPNEFIKEKPYIERNIEFTRRGFALDRIEEQFFPAEPTLSAAAVVRNLETIGNIRLWDDGPLTDVYKQIQLIRPYYDFKDADVDRYVVDGVYRQVLLAAREVAPEKMEAKAQTWVNTRLIYTHGFGLAMSPVTEYTSEGRPAFFAKDIPPDGTIPIQPESRAGDPSFVPETVVTNPRIYYGENTTDYVIVNTNTDELDYQTKEGDLFRTKYYGTGGVLLSSFIRRAAFAWELGDVNILISGEITPASLLQYRRGVQQRISTVAPFLLLDGNPYLAAADGQLHWVQDAYTSTGRYPYSDPLEGRFNYIRNSVKVTVDAYNGTMRFYITDASDPIIQTYAAIFPDLLVPWDEMPAALRAHTRYPEDFFKFQALKYARYHMREPQTFYNNEDRWDIPQEKFGQGAELQPVEPYYVVMRLPGETKAEFVLLLPYTPAQRKNMVGWLVARSDGESYGKLTVFNFPKDRQVYGPEQIEARIDNDAYISQWFTLRCQEGSFCIRGNLLVIPLEDTLLYVEPIYLQAQGVEFPELKQVILATADRVVMRDSVAQALTALTGVSDLSAAFAAGRGPTTPETAPPETVPSAEELRLQIDEMARAIEELLGNLQALEQALDRLKKLTGGD